MLFILVSGGFYSYVVDKFSEVHKICVFFPRIGKGQIIQVCIAVWDTNLSGLLLNVN